MQVMGHALQDVRTSWDVEHSEFQMLQAPWMQKDAVREPVFLQQFQNQADRRPREGKLTEASTKMW